MTAGDRIGAYEVVAPLGAGGMGEVYRARDAKLNREVAIKVLPAALADDPQYMARFEREAQTLAALNHPNIATVYGIEQGALVMELVEGPALADRIAQGPIPFEEALPIARQIAEGLEAAHDRGIVHRDLKPANVKITPAGAVKILDFGLAKTGDDLAAGVSNSISPTLSIAMTQAGYILGTAGYMSPEQARAKPVDRRTDIWAFGVVLYEMLTGRALFAGGETVTDVLAAVVTREPDFGALPPSTPAHIRRLLERCLRKDVKTRLQAIAEARIAIDEPAAEPASAPTPAAPPARASWKPWAAAAALAAVIAAAGWMRALRPAEPHPLMRLDVEISPNAPLTPDWTSGILALSPDGRRIVVSLRNGQNESRLYTRVLNQAQFTPLAGTEGAAGPFFSPDGQWIGFTADGKLKKVSALGGAAVTLCNGGALRGASWGDDGFIVFAPGPWSGLFRVSAAGGTPAPLTKTGPTEKTHRWPHVLPGGDAVLFTAHSGITLFDAARIEAFSMRTGQRKLVHSGGHSARTVRLPDGSWRLLFVNQSTVFSAPFDPARLEKTGPALPVVEQVSSNSRAGGNFSVAAEGTFAYLPGGAQDVNFVLQSADRSGRYTPLHENPGLVFGPRFSPEGKRLAYVAGASQGYDLWVKDLERGTASRLSFLGGMNTFPVWMPDGKSIVFLSTDPARSGLYWLRTDGGGEAVRLTDGRTAGWPSSISSDGKRLAYSAIGQEGSQDVFTAELREDGGKPVLGKPETFVGTRFGEWAAVFSPDGRWIAYASNESGRFEVYVRPFPGPGGRWQISSGGGAHPIWNRNGKELLYLDSAGRVMVAAWSASGDSFRSGASAPWPGVKAMNLGSWHAWDLAPDGRSLAVVRNKGETQAGREQTHLTFLVHFLDDLQGRK